MARLIGEGLGASPDPTFVAACAKVTAGNPFVLRELIFDLAAEGIKPDAARAAGVAERVPAQVERAVLARLGRLDEKAVRLARAVAVLGEGTALRLAAALAGLDIDVAAGAADTLVTAELLAETRPLQFVHPLVRSAVYEQIPSGARSQAHARAAQLLAIESAAPEQVAAQLLLCEPAGDPDAVQALRAAAAAALTRGAPETAVGYLRRALAEPPADVSRAPVLGELGNAEKVARDPAAVVHLEQAWQTTADPLTRARLAGQLSNVLLYAVDIDRCFAVLRAALDDLGDRDPDLAARLHADKAAMELLGVRRPSEAPEIMLEQLRGLAELSSPGSRSAQLALACVLALRGDSCDEVPGLVDRGLAGGRFLVEETCEAIPAALAVWALIHTDELDRARALAEAMLADAQARGSVVGFEAASGRRAVVALRCGDLAEAEADARAALELATEHNLTLGVPLHAAFLGLTLLERGKLDQANAVVEGTILSPALMKGPPIAGALLEARARVRLAHGQRAQAIADLRHCGQLADRAQLHNPNLFAWRSTLALALASDHPQEARELAQEELTLAHRAGSSRAIGIALRACGLLAGGKDGIELLDQSVALLEPSPARLELAHSLTELGAAPGPAPQPENRCAEPWISLPAAAPHRWPSARARRHWLPVPDPGDPGPVACTP